MAHRSPVAASACGGTRALTPPHALLLLYGLAAAAPALAQTEAPPTLEQCAAIGAAADRLTCYDKLAGRAPAPTTPVAQQALASTATPATAEPSLLSQTGGPLPPDSTSASASASSSSLTSKFWELDPIDKRGVFNFVGYQPNYVLPLHVTSRINRAPQSPTQAAVAQPDNRREEAKFQLSLRTKVLQNVGLPGGDLWAAFTVQAMWQVYSHSDSRPFRNTDYQPELIYVVPTAERFRGLPFGWKWRYTQLGVAHQSNGQSDPLSRSWNRSYLDAGFENGNWTFSARVNHRLRERAETNNNPDLVDMRGRTELNLGWASGLHTASLHHRTTFRGGNKGSNLFEWTYPVSRDQPNGLRWYVQVFSGYGETLSDYNFRQTSVGAGVSFLQF
ncbi:phospholipase A [Hydrogenophaga sp. BPS33]|uniref:phospholipase A n=1 Tax=Hydrogenophaga sp. BPS33 TaxID=2651974 RepID=UPI001F1AE416|nr:phospholipase A [Hydrogenophaga sp. BPS33]